MTLGGVNPGDIVLADRKGRRLYAVVTERRERELGVEPIDRRISYRTVKAREVLGIWRESCAKSGQPLEAATTAGMSHETCRGSIPAESVTLRRGRRSCRSRSGFRSY